MISIPASDETALAVNSVLERLSRANAMSYSVS